MEPYADVIIDLSVKNVDRIFQYRIPDHLKELVKPGVQVNIPFGKGNTERKGIVVGLSKETDYDPEKMKELLDVETGAVPIRTQMICLAFWMKDRYSTTMNQALKTVLPVKAKVMPREERVIVSLKPKNEIETLLIEAEKKKYRARIRLHGRDAETVSRKRDRGPENSQKRTGSRKQISRDRTCCPESGTEERGGDRDPGL